MIEAEPIVFVVDTTHRSVAPSSASPNPLDSKFKPSALRGSVNHFIAHYAMQVRVIRFVLLASVHCQHDDCVIVIVNHCATRGILARWHDCNSKSCSGALSIESWQVRV
jgi:hypothetical protein